MASTKEINLFLNFKEDTPNEIISSLRNFKINSGEPLCTDYRHACGQPVIEFYAASERLGEYQRDDKTYYLRYCNTIKDYDNRFETWLNSIAPWVIQINGHHVGTLYYSDTEELKLICVKDGNVLFTKYIPCAK